MLLDVSEIDNVLFQRDSDAMRGKFLQVRGEVSPAWLANAAAMIIITIITITGNAAVILAIKRASPRFPAHYPLASLAAADFTLGLFVLPLSAARELFLFRPYRPVCAFWSTMDVLCSTASILSLCTLGWERWSGITSPLARARRAKAARLFAALIWPVAAAVALPTALIPTHGHHLPHETVKACTVNTNIGYVFFSVSFSFYLPASGMLFLYTKILLALACLPTIRRHRGKTIVPPGLDTVSTIQQLSMKQTKIPKLIHSTPKSKPKTVPDKGVTINNNRFAAPNRHALEDRKTNVVPIPSPLLITAGSPGGLIPRQRRATHTIMILMSVFFMCWLPFFIMLPIDSLCECVSDRAWLICTWLGYTNSALDPLVYAVASPTVCRALRATLTMSYSSTRSREIPLTPRVKRRLKM